MGYHGSRSSPKAVAKPKSAPTQRSDPVVLHAPSLYQTSGNWRTRRWTYTSDKGKEPPLEANSPGRAKVRHVILQVPNDAGDAKSAAWDDVAKGWDLRKQLREAQSRIALEAEDETGTKILELQLQKTRDALAQLYKKIMGLGEGEFEPPLDRLTDIGWLVEAATRWDEPVADLQDRDRSKVQWGEHSNEYVSPVMSQKPKEKDNQDEGAHEATQDPVIDIINQIFADAAEVGKDVAIDI